MFSNEIVYMKPTQLSEYPRLRNVLSPRYYDEIRAYSETSAGGNAFINLYSVFVSLTTAQSKHGYGALDIRNDAIALERHYRLFIGFLWCKYITLSHEAKRHYTNLSYRVLKQLTNSNNLNITRVKTSRKKTTTDIQLCVDEFYSIDLPLDLLKYYEGWTVSSKEGKEFNLHLAYFYDTYGRELTDKCCLAISNYMLTQKSRTAEGLVLDLTALLNAFIRLCPSKEHLEHHLQPSHSFCFFENIMNILFAESQAKGHDPKTFFRHWKQKVKSYYECFIDAGIFDEPLKPILTPDFKEPKDSALTFSIGGNLTSGEVERWLVDIPLYIKDEEAVTIIQQRLERDLSHIKAIAQKQFEGIKYRLERNRTYIRKGKIKPYGQVSGTNAGFNIGLDHLQNTIATFYHHGFKDNNYSRFLGFSNNIDQLHNELCLPTGGTIHTLISLLILEHPQITPTWLEKWELFDKSGTQVGFKQVGNCWIAVSYKDRRGASNSQQEIALNNYTKEIVETLIEVTQFSREHLRLQGNKYWRAMLLTANLSRAIRTSSLVKCKSFRRNEFNKSLSVTSYYPTGEVILARDEAEKMSGLVTLRSIRKARALQIYLETRSFRAVAEALGHKSVRTQLLGSYLPKPLIDFFNARWVRQFQNAIIFEAMKDSPYLFDALDFSYDELAEFLENHGIKSLPEYSDQALVINKTHAKDSNINNPNNEITFTLSTALLQVLIAIQAVIESSDEHDTFKDVVITWYESAVFILTSLSLESKSHMDAKPLLEAARANPLNISLFKENLQCR